MDADAIKTGVWRVLEQLVVLAFLGAFLYICADDPFLVPADNPWLADGITPRELRGLPGILVAPFHHADHDHLYQNLLPLLIMGWGILLEGSARFWQASLFITVASGLIVWLLGVDGHLYLGSSAVVFGYMGFLMMRAYASRRPLWIALAIVATLIFGGRVFSIALGRGDPGWLGHTSGFVAGIWCAAVMHRPRSAVDGHW